MAIPGAARPQRWRAPGPGIRVAIHFGFLAQTLMKILQLISSAGHYGAENMLLNLAKSLERLGCTCVLGVFENLHRPSTEIAEHAQQLGLQTVAIRCQGRADREAIQAIRSHIETQGRSEERRVGKECRSRWSPYH